MELNRKTLSDRAFWEAAGVSLPDYEPHVAAARTRERPRWLHFGAGNLCRSVPVRAAQKMLAAGATDTGLIVCESVDGDLIDRIWRPHDNLSILALPGAGGDCHLEILASVADSLRTDGSCARDDERLREIFRSAALEMISFTITAKGYRLRNARGEFFPWIRRDMEGDPVNARTPMGRLTRLLLERFAAGAAPVALVSMDNLPRGGEWLRDAVQDIAGVWLYRGAVSQKFYDYLSDPDRVSFPLAMIDRITPRPDPAIVRQLAERGIQVGDMLYAGSAPRAAAFVNAERSGLIVIEDRFPAGRPDLTAGGILLTDRETVLRAERMKACSCLSPARTALALVGRLLCWRTLAEAMTDDDLRPLVERVVLREGLPVCEDPGIVSPAQYAREALENRLTNPCLADTTERVATDTSLKLAARYGETIRAGRPASLKGVCFVLAAYLRYLMGLDDNLEPFEPSPDPQLETLRDQLMQVRFRSDESQYERIAPMLRWEWLWGVDLEAAGLSGQIASCFDQMLEGRGAVRDALRRLNAQP